MITITFEQFQNFIKSGWTREQNWEFCGEMTTIKDGKEIESGYGWASLTSSKEGVSITHNRGFFYDLYEPDTLDSYAEGDNGGWVIDGLQVMDGDEVVGVYELSNYLDSEFSDIDFSDIKDAINVVEDIE